MKYNIRLALARYTIAAFACAGIMGATREIAVMSGLNLIYGAYIILALISAVYINTFLQRTYPYWVRENLRAGRERYYKTYPEQRETVRLKKRCQAIMNIANQNMKKGELPKGHRNLEHVMVPWEDLLKMWDIAERIQSETPIED